MSGNSANKALGKGRATLGLTTNPSVAKNRASMQAVHCVGFLMVDGAFSLPEYKYNTGIESCQLRVVSCELPVASCLSNPNSIPFVIVSEGDNEEENDDEVVMMN